MGSGRGGRRIGIVLSVIWFITFGAYFWSLEFGRQKGFYRSQLEICNRILRADNVGLEYIIKPDEREKRRLANWKTHQDCQNRALAFFSAEFDELRQKGILIVLAVDAATILVGWLVVWGLVSTVRRIGQGFAQGNAFLLFCSPWWGGIEKNGPAKNTAGPGRH